MRYLIFCFSFTFFISKYALAQDSKEASDFKCFDKNAHTSFDFLKTTRSYGNYEPEQEWSKQLSSDKIEKKIIELDGGRQYTFLLVTEVGVEGTAIEIRDQMGVQLEYNYNVNEFDNREINFFFTPADDGVYQILFRVINSKKASTCAYMAILQGDLDPDMGGDQE